MRSACNKEDSTHSGELPHTITLPGHDERGGLSLAVTREARRLQKQLQLRKLSLAGGRYWNQWQLWRHWVTKPHTPYQAVFVIATPRSGSNLLIDYLFRLPGVESLSEVLNWGMAIGPKKLLHAHKVLKHIQQSFQTLQATTRSCKIFLNQIDHYRLTIDDFERDFPNARYLVLYRQNLAEQFVSNQAARTTGQWILLPGHKPKKVALPVNPAELKAFCDDTRRKYSKIAACEPIASRGAIFSYEELVSRPEQCLRDIICPLLGVPYVAPATALCKQNAEPLEQRVPNYSEVASLMNSECCRLKFPSRLGLSNSRQVA